MIAKALYTKFASSQQYFYSKDLNDMLSGTRAPNCFKIKDNF